MNIYTCKHCGKRLRPVVIWQCEEEMWQQVHVGEAFYLTIDHTHEPDVADGDPVIVTVRPATFVPADDSLKQ